MLSGRRYLLGLSPEQEQMCEEFGNICRSVWNTALEQRREYRRRGAWMNYAPQCAELADAKREHPWLKRHRRTHCGRRSKDLDRACREHGTFKVRWHSKARWSPSFRFPDAKQSAWSGWGAKWGRAHRWHGLELALANAARYTSTRVVKVDPAYTSQRCSACGFVAEEDRESQAVFRCKAPGCTRRDHAVVNAAKNIKAAGHAVSACADPGTSRSVKQESSSRATGRTPSWGIPGLQPEEEVN